MLSSLLLLTTIALAEGPKFSVLGEQEPTPFEGVLFDPEATAIIMSDREFASASCDLEIEFNLDKQATQYHLQLQNAQIRYDSLKEETDLLITQKDIEIDTLQETLKKQSPYNKWLWFGAGTAAGGVVTVALINAATKWIEAGQ